MGLISALIRSYKKSKMMKKLIKTLSFSKCDNEEREKITKEFYDFIYNDNILGSILKRHNVTYEVFANIFERYLALGYNYWQGTNYIPVSLFSFARPLDYIMSNKKIFEKDGSYDEVIKICYTSKKLL